MKNLQLLVLSALFTVFQTGYGEYDVNCVPNSAKGVYGERWDKVDDLLDLKSKISNNESAHNKRYFDDVSQTFSNSNTGQRFRTFFLCPLTGQYVFHHSCDWSCEWFIKEAEDSPENITGGIVQRKMSRTDFREAQPAADLIEGHTYYFEELLYHDGHLQHFKLQVSGPNGEPKKDIAQKYLVKYEESGVYPTIDAGEWEAWSPCSGTCGVLGDQSRIRTCLTHSSLFSYSPPNVELTESRVCSAPCDPGVCICTLIDIAHDQLTLFHIPFNASALPENLTHEVNYPDEDHLSWCYRSSVATYLEVNLTRPYYIQAIETKAIHLPGLGTVRLPLYLLEVFTDYATNCSDWEFDQEENNITVFEGNSEHNPASSKKHNITAAFIVATLIRIWPVTLNASCTYLRIYGEPALAPTDPPLDLEVRSTGPTSLMIVWDHLRAYFPVRSVVGYEVEIFNTSGLIDKQLILHGEQGMDLIGLEEFTEYCATVHAITDHGTGKKTNQVCNFTVEGVPSAAPANVTAEVLSSTSCIVSWDALPSSSVNGMLTGYKVKYIKFTSSSSSSDTISPPVQTKILNSLEKNTEYCVQVAAMTRIGVGNFSDCVHFTTHEDAPSKHPKDLHVTGTSPSTLLVTWSHIPPQDRNGIVRFYQLKYQEDHRPPGTNWTLVKVDGNFTEANISGLTDDTNYCVKVSAITVSMGPQSPCKHGRTSAIEPVDGGYTTWSAWGMCSASCDGGQQGRLRTCTDPPPSNKGKPCEGLENDNRPCNEHGCPVCLNGWIGFGQHCYQPQSSRKTWEEARKGCLNLNSDLVSITSSQENTFVNSLLETLQNSSWIGLSDRAVEGNYVWTDVTVFNFTAWFSDENYDEPNGFNRENCVILQHSKWADYSCASTYHYVCKRKARVLKCQAALGMQSGAISDAQISASSELNAAHAARQARLYNVPGEDKSGSWSAGTRDQNQWLQVDLGGDTNVTRIATQGRHLVNYNQWVTKYKLQYSIDGASFHYYKDKVFDGNCDKDTVVYHQLNPPIRARYIRVRPMAWHGYISMRIELYDCPDLNLESPSAYSTVGMEDGRICDDQITSNSFVQGFEPHKARLGHLTTWCSNSSSSVYLQINLNATYVIGAVETQGHHSDRNSFVKEYKMEFSIDGSEGDFYRDEMGIKSFPGNNDSHTAKNNSFSKTVYARYVRFWPTLWSHLPCMRIELYGEISHCDHGLPPAVSNITVFSVGIHAFKLSWNSVPVYRVAAPVQGYKITYKPQTGAEENNVTIDVDKNITSLNIKDLERDTVYCVTVSAYNQHGNGASIDCTKVKTGTACLQEWTQFIDKCYLLIKDDFKTWFQSTAECFSRNSHLVAIQNIEEDQFIDSLLAEKLSVNNSVFIGLKDTGTGFQHWDHGVNVQYTNWPPTPPTPIIVGNVCVTKPKGGGGYWYKANCTDFRPFICEKKGFYFNETCEDTPVGMETGVIPNNNITASSFMESSPPWAARLGDHVGWCPLTSTNAFLQVDLGAPHYICRVVIQGQPKANFGYVTKYAIELSLDGTHWEEYEEKIKGSNHWSRAKNRPPINSGVVAQFVRFLPEEWHVWPCMRVEIYGNPADPFPPPTKAPSINEALSNSSTYIKFELSPPRSYYAAYDILDYIVNYWKQDESSSDANSTAFRADNMPLYLTGLDKNTNYCLSAQVRTSYGPGVSSPCVWVRTNEDVPDGPPSNVRADSISSTSINVTWQPIPDDLQNGHILGYRVIYKKQKTVAVSRKKRSVAPPLLDSVTLPPPLLDTSSVALSGSGEEVDATFSEQRLEIENEFTVYGERNLSWTIEGLAKFTDYCVQVLGFNVVGNGSASDWIFVKTDEDVPSAPPSNITAHNTSSSSILVRWSPVPLGHENGVVIGYKVMYVDEAGSRARQQVTVESTLTSVEVTGLLVITKYCIRVLAFTQLGDGPESDCVVTSTGEDVPSMAPVAPLAYSTDLVSVDLFWNPIPTKELNGELVSYTVLIQESNITVFTSPCQLSFKLQGVNLTLDSCIQMAATTRVGFGIFTECIEIIVAPTNLTMTGQVTASKHRGLSTVKVTWENEEESNLSAAIVGFYIKYQPISTGGEPLQENQTQPQYLAVCNTLNEVILTNLTSYTKYKVEVALFTKGGRGNYKEPVYGETCRCTEHLSVSLIPSPLDSSLEISAGLIGVIGNLITETCGFCEEHSETTLQPEEEGLEQDVTFPVSRTQAFGNTAYSKFIPIISVPGMVLIQRKGDNSGLLTKVMAVSVFDSWPAFIITVVLALLAGIIIWFLDSKANPDHFPRRFLKGAGEGFWWSFITMTTVGYGDRCPQSIPAKVFSIAWSLIGLIVFGIFMGSLTAVLTVTVAKMSSGGFNTGDGKVGVVSASTEHQMAINKFRNKIEIGSSYPDMNTMVQALRDGNISSVLLEMYVPVKRKDLFNGSWFEVADVLQAEIEHGVLLQGGGLKLSKDLETLIKKKNVQTTYLQQGDKMEDVESESTSVVFFEPSSPYYFNTMVISVGLLLLATACGLLYQAFCFQQFCNDVEKDADENSQGTCKCGELKKDITSSVEDFYQNFSKTYRRIRKRHVRQLIKYMANTRRV